jgi:hypothetical protein
MSVCISAYVSIRQHTSAYVSIRQHTSAYVSIRQHTSAYRVAILALLSEQPLKPRGCGFKAVQPVLGRAGTTVPSYRSTSWRSRLSVCPPRCGQVPSRTLVLLPDPLHGAPRRAWNARRSGPIPWYRRARTGLKQEDTNFDDSTQRANDCAQTSY